MNKKAVDFQGNHYAISPLPSLSLEEILFPINFVAGFICVSYSSQMNCRANSPVEANTNFIMSQNSFVLKSTGVNLSYFYLFQYLINYPSINLVCSYSLLSCFLSTWLNPFIYTSYFLFKIIFSNTP